MIILGIDPGTRIAGYAVVRFDKGKTQILTCGYLAFKSTESITHRIGQFHSGINQLIASWSPEVIAIETPFLGKNAQNFLKLGYLRGIIHLLVYQHQLALAEFSPREVKAAVTGSGSAEKEQVARALHAMFPSLPLQAKADVTDAVAVALSGAWCNRSLQNTINRVTKPISGGL